MPQIYKCNSCLDEFTVELGIQPHVLNGKTLCNGCWDLSQLIPEKLEKAYGDSNRPHPYDKPQSCCVCHKTFETLELRNQYEGQLFCIPCYEKASDIGEQLARVSKIGHPTEPFIKKVIFNEPTTGVQAVMYNEPAHYHQHQIDTIEFLQKGFPPEVFMGFAIGHIIKYAQRANYKNGREDFVKMVDYAKRALDWYDKRYIE